MTPAIRPARTLIVAGGAAALVAALAAASPGSPLGTGVAFAGPGGGLVGDIAWATLTLGIGAVAATWTRGAGSTFDELRRLRLGSRRRWWARELARAAGGALLLLIPASAVALAGAPLEVARRFAAVPLQVLLATVALVAVMRLRMPALARLGIIVALVVVAALPPSLVPASPLALGSLARVTELAVPDFAATLAALLAVAFVGAVALIAPARPHGSSSRKGPG